MADVKYTPSIILPGIGQSKVEMVDRDGKKIKMAWPLDVDGEAVLGKLKAPLAKMMLFRRDGGFSDKVADIVAEIADPIANKENGEPKNRLRVVTCDTCLRDLPERDKRYVYRMVPLQRVSDIIGEENVYFFAYHSFGDIYSTAADLDKFITKVKEETGSERVNLVPVSLGGSLCTAYLDAYGYKNDIKRVMYFVAALEGTKLIADLMNKNIKTDDLGSALSLFASPSQVEKLSPFMKMLPAGVTEACIDKAIDALLDKAVVNSTQIWATVPPEDYPRLAGRFLSDKKHALIREKTDRFAKAQANIRGIIAERQANGTSFFAVCGYNRQLLSLSASDTISSDSIINTSSASLGAVCAPLGQTLDEKPGSVLSPDRTVDASTCFMPGTTWFFKDQYHDAIAYNDTALDVAKMVLTDDSFTGVDSDPALPQFGSASDNRKKD